MNVLPIGFTHFDWLHFSKIIEHATHISPTRGMDLNGLDIKDPFAMMGCIDLKNIPLELLRSDGPHLRMVSMTLLVFADEYEISKILMTTGLYGYTPNNGTDIFYVSGNLKQYCDAILNNCTSTAHKISREFCTHVLWILDKTLMREFFKKYQRKDHCKDQVVLYAKS